MKNCPKCGAEKNCENLKGTVMFNCRTVIDSGEEHQSDECARAELAILKEKLNVAGRLVSDAKDLVGDSAYPIGSAQHLLLRAAKQFLDENPELRGGKEG